MTLRIATREDLPVILAIMRHADVRPHLGGEVDDDWLTIKTAETFEKFLYLLVEPLEAAFFQLERMREPSEFAVHVAATPLVKGAAMIAAGHALVAFAREMGVERLWAWTPNENRRARIYAALCGMKDCAAPGDWCAWMYTTEHGRWMSLETTKEVPCPP